MDENDDGCRAGAAVMIDDMQSPGHLRLLVIAPYAAYPPVGGGKMRIYHLLQEWLHLGHDVTLWVAPPDEPELGWSGGERRPHLRAMLGRSRHSLGSKLSSLVSPLPEEVWARPVSPDGLSESPDRYDLVVLMQAHTGQYASRFLAAGVPTVLDQQNVETQISAEMAHLAPTWMGRGRARLDTVKWRAYESDLVRRVQLTVAVSESDAQSLRRMAPSARVVVRPSGADLRSLRYVDHAGNRGDRLIMTGTLGYLPNLDAANWMIDEILPRVRRVRPAARLVLVGAGAPESLLKRASASVEIAGRVPDVPPYLDRADLFVAPLRAGGGTRLKLLEAFAVGLPVVATTIAAAGIAIRPGIDLAIADDEETFANEIVRLLDDTSARRATAESARRLVEERYDWRTIADEYQKDLFEVVRSARRGLP